MENQIHYTTTNDLVAIKKKIRNDESLFIGEITGSEIKQLQDFLAAMSQVFLFPHRSYTVDGYYDWMRDLEWVDKDGYVLIIHDYKDFLCQDISSKNEVIDGFARIILPFWEDEVTEVVVGGKAKSFMVYLVVE